MSRILEKVKDIIDVCPYESPVDFQADPAMTLSSYHFTDVTSGLMAKWLDDLIGVSMENGRAKALAGYRGVGKSHFLAVFGSLLANPELRSKVTDSHVAASAQVLMRRHYPVAYVRRGTKDTLIDELKDGVSETLGFNLNEIPDTVEDILSFIGRKNTDVPFVIIVDTAYERELRVSRDDGSVLGQLAEVGKEYNIFVGIALDDDITDADGINVAIARTFTIDYLDQEHLYRIVNNHIFPKNRQSQTLLSQIYRFFREVSPGFHWSEQSFTALYPLHPSILEVAPFIRLYASNFALFGFASDAGEKILGRPASSLISLDEVFDNVEHRLRKSEELREAFEVFDQISREIVSLVPVMQRLQAKLILKALFVLSLDGDGTTAAEICAAMLIYDEKDPHKAIRNVEDLLDTIVSIFPEDLKRKADEGKETRFSLKVGTKDNLNNALDEAIQTVSPTHIPQIMRRVAKDKFPDWNLSVDGRDEMEVWTDCQIKWRGGFRRCRLYWNWDNEAAEVLQILENSDYLDLEIFVNNPLNPTLELSRKVDSPRAIWQPAELTKDEAETILRFYVLLNDEQLRTEYREQVRAAGHTHSLQIEKIWERIFFKDAKLLVENGEYGFVENLRDKQTLGELLSENLEPYFESIYPEHPLFAEPLGMNEVSKLVNDLFSGARKTHDGIQHLAETFALPLGLVALKGDNYILETEENLYRHPLVEKILTLVSQSENSTVLLKTIYRRLKEKPFGLIREAQHLILAALVAQRKVEFVTTNGDRISRRSLDLKIIWDDIAGIAKPADIIYGSKRLTEWAKILTELEDVQIIDVAEDRNRVKEGLRKWLENWNAAGILERFNELSDEILNTKIWYISVKVEKTFGTVANSVQMFFDESISLEVCLQRIADAFSDSEEEYQLRQNDLITLVSFIKSASNREWIWGYLAICEKTARPEIEDLRNKLFDLLEETSASPTSEKNREMEMLWREFHKLFGEHFSIKHDTIMKSHQLQEKFDEILKSDQWWEFQNLSQLPVFHQKFWKDAQRIIKQFEELDCRFDVREMLNSYPFCACSFNLTQMQKWEDLPKLLILTIEKGRESYRRTLHVLNESLIQALQNYLRDENEEDFIRAGSDLILNLQDTSQMPQLSTIQLNILHRILAEFDSSPTINVGFPEQSGLISSEELRQNLNKWLDELPSESVYLQVR
jgi:hypothetical protein